MKGGFVNCNTTNNHWERVKEYGVKDTSESKALNNLGICRFGYGTDKYFKNEPYLKEDWYINSEKNKKKNIRNILEDLKNKNIKNINDNKKYNKNDFQEPLKLLEDELTYRINDVLKHSLIENKDIATIQLIETHDTYIRYLKDFRDEINKNKNLIDEKIRKKKEEIKSSKSKKIIPNFSVLSIEGEGKSRKKTKIKKHKSKKTKRKKF
tara:strand:- start:965 stop:1591 length:627 start_codon:yes stop_codon:yes gene_type:complete